MLHIYRMEGWIFVSIRFAPITWLFFGGEAHDNFSTLPRISYHRGHFFFYFNNEMIIFSILFSYVSATQQKLFPTITESLFRLKLTNEVRVSNIVDHHCAYPKFAHWPWPKKPKNKTDGTKTINFQPFQKFSHFRLQHFSLKKKKKKLLIDNPHKRHQLPRLLLKKPPLRESQKK